MVRIAHKSKETVVYRATNKVNGKRYIGITCRGMNERRSKHFWAALSANSQAHFHRAIRKYGRDNFEFSELERCATYAEAVLREIALIASLNPGYNQSLGGDGYLGWSPSEEQRRKQSERLRGKPGPWAGKPLAASFLAAQRRWNASDEGRASWKECARLGPLSRARAVVCLDDGLAFGHAGLAGDHYGIDPGTIFRVCRRDPRRKTAAGLVFRFVGEDHGGRAEADQERALRLANRRRSVALARECARAGQA